ncbi:hypothetical protein TNCV_3815571 [Trichonephila clavipes]|nr:hypothetical protein TNCV_3815571 [Trichonephila clavipes]
MLCRRLLISNDNDDEIVTYVQEESDPVDDENNNESSKGSSIAAAFSTLETAMEFDRFLMLHGWLSVFCYLNIGFLLSEHSRFRMVSAIPIDSD